MKVTCMELVKDYILNELSTEKAYALDDGYTSTLIHGRLQTKVKWIPKSITINQDNKIYVPYLTIQNYGLWDWINKSNKILIEDGKKRATGKDLILKKLNRELKDRKNQAIVLYDTKQFEEICNCKEFEYYTDINRKGFKNFNNFETEGIIAIFELDNNNKIINSMIQNDEILNTLKKAQREYLDITIEYLS